MAEIKKINTELQLLDKFLDTSGDAGSANQVLVSTTTGVNWVDGSGSGIIGGPYLPLTGGTLNSGAALNMSGTLTIDGSSSVKMLVKGGARIALENANATDSFYIANTGGNLASVLDLGSTLTIAENGGASTFAGNVGIGTTSPEANLEIESSTGGVLRLTSSNTTVLTGESIGKIEFKSNDASTGGNNVMGFINSVATNAGTRYALSFGTGDAAAAVERMRITNEGNVGIGTSVMNTTLNLYSASNTQMTFQDASTGTGNSDGFRIGYNGTYGQLYLFENADFRIATNNAERMRITAAGNVGIGTTTPTNYKLQVDGTVESAAFSVEGTPARIFAPSGASYNGSGGQTGYLIIKLPDNGLGGINNMMTGVIRVFDYTHNESFDVHFAGYWYGTGYHWTNCSAWIDSSANSDRNFTVRFGEMVGSAGANTRPYITIGEAASTWTYCKFSVINFEPGHSNAEAYKWDSGWSMDISATNPGNVIKTKTNCQVNNWQRNGQNVYYGSGTGNVGIGTTAPAVKLHIAGTGAPDIRVQDLDGTNQFISIGHNNGNTTYVSRNNTSFGTHIFYGANGSATTERMRITSAGNVGIGTTSPSALLHVSQPSANTVLRIGNNTTYDQFIYFNGNNDWSLGMDYSNSNAFVLSNSSTIGTNDRVVVTTAGNVGIGTTSPGAKLDVQGDEASLRIKDTTSGKTWDWQVHSTYMEFGEVNVANNRLVIKNGGNVGIGTTSPSSKLHIESDLGAAGTFLTLKNSSSTYQNSYTVGTVDKVLKITGGSSSQDAVLFEDTLYVGMGSNTNVGIGTTSPDRPLSVVGGNSMVARFQSTNTTAFIQFSNTVSTADQVRIGSNGTNLVLSTNYAERMRIDSSGNVGVGTTSPAYKLDVSGEIRSSSNVRVGTNLLVGGYTDITGVVNHRDDIRVLNKLATNWISWAARNTLGSDSVIDLSSIGTLTTSGNVGIGTTSPSEELTIAAENPTIRLEDISSGNNAEIYVNNFDTYINSAGRFFVQNAGSSTLAVYSGNVGIGTTNPSQLLHIESTSTNARTVIKTTATGNFTAASQIVCNDSDLFFGAADDGYTSVPEYTGKPFLQGNGGHFAIVAQGGSDDLQFYAGGRGSADKHMVITGANSGRVGIGTNSPSAKLDVNGTASISGAATMAATVKMIGLSQYADDIAAGNAGLQTGDLYYSVSGGDRVIKMKI